MDLRSIENDIFERQCGIRDGDLLRERGVEADPILFRALLHWSWLAPSQPIHGHSISRQRWAGGGWSYSDPNELTPSCRASPPLLKASFWNMRGQMLPADVPSVGMDRRQSHIQEVQMGYLGVEQLLSRGKGKQFYGPPPMNPVHASEGFPWSRTLPLRSLRFHSHPKDGVLSASELSGGGG